MGCLSDKYTQRIVSGLEIIKLWPTVAHVHRKVPIEYNGEPQIRPQNTPSCGPIAKPHHLPHPWTSPTYGAKLHPDPIHRCSTMHWTDRQIVHGKVWRLYVAALRERRDLIISDCRKPNYAVSHHQSIIYLFIYTLQPLSVSGPRYATLANGRRWMSLQIKASGYEPRDVRVLVDRNQLLVDATHSESHSVPVTSSDPTSGYSSDVTHRRLSRRYLLHGYVRAADLRCFMTSDGTLSIEGEMRGVGDDHVTSAGVNGRKTSRYSKHVKFDLS